MTKAGRNPIAGFRLFCVWDWQGLADKMPARRTKGRAREKEEMALKKNEKMAFFATFDLISAVLKAFGR